MTFSSFMKRSAKEKRKEQFFYKLLSRQRHSVGRLCRQAEEELDRKQKENDMVMKEVKLKEESISELKKSVAALKNARNSGNSVFLGCSEMFEDVCVKEKNKIMSKKENVRFPSSNLECSVRVRKESKFNFGRGQDFAIPPLPKGILKKNPIVLENLGLERKGSVNGSATLLFQNFE